MKAIVYREYGSADVLKFEEVPQPTPADNEVLIKKVCALRPCESAGLAHDEGCSRGLSVYLPELQKPKRTRLGGDMAGDVVSVGTAMSGLKPGDGVFGAVRRGLRRKNMCALLLRRLVAIKPENMTSASRRLLHQSPDSQHSRLFATKQSSNRGKKC